MKKIDQDIEGLILKFQERAPVDILELAHALGVDVKQDQNPPLKKGKGRSCVRIVIYPTPVIYYNDFGSHHKIKFNIAVALSYYLLYSDYIIKNSTYGESECAFYLLFWSTQFKARAEKRNALLKAVDLLVPRHLLKKILRDNLFEGDLVKMAQYFDVQPSVISIALGIPYES